MIVIDNENARLRGAREYLLKHREWLQQKLAEIHEITQDPNVSPLEKIDNIAATAAKALDPAALSRS